MPESSKDIQISTVEEEAAIINSPDYQAKLSLHRRSRWRGLWLGILGVVLILLALLFKNSLSDGLMKTLIIQGVFMSGATIGVKGFDRFWFESGCINNLRGSVENRRRLLELILRGKPFLLYLHDVASERPKYLRTLGFVPTVLFSDTSEAHIEKQINGKFPGFAFLNHWDPSPGAFRRIVAADDKEWFELYKLYCDAAALVIFDLDEIGDSIVRELGHVSEKNLAHKTIFILTEQAEASVSKSFPEVYGSAAFSALREGRHTGKAELPAALVDAAFSRARPIFTITVQKEGRPASLTILENVARDALGGDFEAAVVIVFYLPDQEVQIKLAKTSRDRLPFLLREIREGLTVATKDHGSPL